MYFQSCCVSHCKAVCNHLTGCDVIDRVSRREHGDPQIEELNVGEASEPDGRGTGEFGRTLCSPSSKSINDDKYLLCQNLTIRWH